MPTRSACWPQFPRWAEKYRRLGIDSCEFVTRMAWFDTKTNLGGDNCDPAEMQNKTHRRRIVTLLNEIKGLTVWDVTSLFGAFLTTIAPGVLILYVFAPELVLQLATLKLFVFSAALTLPVIAANAFVVAVVGPFTGSIGSGEGTRKHVYFWQVTWAFLTLYSALLVAYLCEPSVLSFIGTTAALDVVFGVIILWIMRFLVRPTS